jgi:aminotransferase
VLADEVYEHIRYGDVPHVSFASLPGMKKRTLTVNGFSKTYSMTGWRLGFVAAPRDLILALIRVHQYSVTSAVSFVQKGGVAALNGRQDCVAAMVGEFGQRRDVVVEAIRAIPELSLVEPQGAFYAFPNVQGLGLSDREVCSRLLHDGGVATVPGCVFGELGEGYIRFAFSASLDEVVEGMRRTQAVCRGIARR